jgi:hypothetical protein
MAINNFRYEEYYIFKMEKDELIIYKETNTYIIFNQNLIRSNTINNLFLQYFEMFEEDDIKSIKKLNKNATYLELDAYDLKNRVRRLYVDIEKEYPELLI